MLIIFVLWRDNKHAGFKVYLKRGAKLLFNRPSVCLTLPISINVYIWPGSFGHSQRNSKNLSSYVGKVSITNSLL